MAKPGAKRRVSVRRVPSGRRREQMLRHLGLVHMNGRIYDPYSGRFLSPDPFVQSPGDLQNYNRYGYVLNNPLSYIDPSGYFFSKLFRSVARFVKNYWKPILAIAVTALTAGWAAWALAGFQGTFFGAMGAIATGGFSAVGTFGLGQSMLIGFAGGFAGGLVGTGSLRGALFGGFAGALAGGIGYGFEGGFGDAFGRAKELARAAAHGINGGVMSELGGGSFRAGFLGGSFGSAASHYGPQFDNFGGNLVKSAVIGGTASKLGGGKFENGAISASFQHLFNEGMGKIAELEKRHMFLVARTMEITYVDELPIPTQGKLAKAARWIARGIGLYEDRPSEIFVHFRDEGEIFVPIGSEVIERREASSVIVSETKRSMFDFSSRFSPERTRWTHRVFSANSTVRTYRFVHLSDPMHRMLDLHNINASQIYRIRVVDRYYENIFSEN